MEQVNLGLYPQNHYYFAVFINEKFITAQLCKSAYCLLPCLWQISLGQMSLGQMSLEQMFSEQTQ
jgi:hypothetical protein